MQEKGTYQASNLSRKFCSFRCRSTPHSWYAKWPSKQQLAPQHASDYPEEKYCQPKPILIKASWSTIRPQRKSQQTPDLFNHHTFKENMMPTSFLCAKGTRSIAFPPSSTQVILSQDSIMRNQPHKDFGLQWNFGFPRFLRN
jgi:hypothetical protein